MIEDTPADKMFETAIFIELELELIRHILKVDGPDTWMEEKLADKESELAWINRQFDRYGPDLLEP